MIQHLEWCIGATRDPVATRGAPSIGVADRLSRHHHRPKTAAGKEPLVDPLGFPCGKTLSGPSYRSHGLDHDRLLSHAETRPTQMTGPSKRPQKREKKELCAMWPDQGSIWAEIRPTTDRYFFSFLREKEIL